MAEADRNKYRLLILIGAIILFISLLMVWVTYRQRAFVQAIRSFEECEAAGYQIMESYPPQCRTPDGQIFFKSITDQPVANVPEPLPVWVPPDSISISKDQVTGWNVFTSKHKFSVKYPPTWRLDAYVEGYSTVADAEKVGGNYFHIFSYPEDYEGNPGAPVPSDELKVETWLYELNGTSLDQFVDQSTTGSKILKTESYSTDGKAARKIWVEDEIAGQDLTVYYVDGNMGAVFISWPFDTKYAQEFDAIVQSFRFIN